MVMRSCKTYTVEIAQSRIQIVPPQSSLPCQVQPDLIQSRRVALVLSGVDTRAYPIFGFRCRTKQALLFSPEKPPQGELVRPLTR